MADELDARQPTLVEAGLERKDHRQAIHQARDLADPSTPPGPHLRPDIVQHGHADRPCDTREPEIELREVDQDAEIGTLPPQDAGEGPVDPHQRAQASDAFHHPDGRDLSRIGDRPHARGAQVLATEAEDLDVGHAAAQRPQQVRTVQVAGRLPRDHEDAVRRRNGHRLRRFSGLTHTLRGDLGRAHLRFEALTDTCATSSARRPSQPVTGGGCRARTACTKASISSSRASPPDLEILERERRRPASSASRRRRAPGARRSRSRNRHRAGRRGACARARSDTRLAVRFAMQPFANRMPRIRDVDRRRQDRDTDGLHATAPASAPW